MKVYTSEEVAAGDFARKNLAEELRALASKTLAVGEQMLLSEFVKIQCGKLDMSAYASVRTCFTPKNGFKITKDGKRLYIKRTGEAQCPMSH